MRQLIQELPYVDSFAFTREEFYGLKEAEDLEVFQTEVRVLFRALQYRKDRAGLQRLLQSDARYQRVDSETFEVMSEMLDLPAAWKHREEYLLEEEKKEEYNVCQAVREWAEEERSIGRAEGIRLGAKENQTIVVRNMLHRGMSDEDIMAIAECDQHFIDGVRADR